MAVDDRHGKTRQFPVLLHDTGGGIHSVTGVETMAHVHVSIPDLGPWRPFVASDVIDVGKDANIYTSSAAYIP